MGIILALKDFDFNADLHETDQMHPDFCSIPFWKDLLPLELFHLAQRLHPSHLLSG